MTITMCFIYLSADQITTALPLRMFSVDFTWSISPNFTSGYVQWFLSELQFHGLHLTFFSMDSTLLIFTWYSIQMDSNGIYLTWYRWILPQLIFNNLYGRLLSVGFTFHCLRWTYLRHTTVEFYLRLTKGDLGRNSMNFPCGSNVGSICWHLR